MALQRTAKSCRSDAPMLASSLREEAQATVSNKHGHRGEHEVSRKTIARGMPGHSGVTVVTNSCVCFFTHEAAGALGTRLSLRPLFSERQTNLQNSGESRRGNACSCLKLGSRHCGEAIHSRRAKKRMDCFVASLLAMTTLAV